MRIDTKQITSGTIIRTVCLVLALANQILTVCGKTPLPITDAQVADAVALIATVATSLWAWWKNNSFTSAAIEGDKYKEVQKHAYAIDSFVGDIDDDEDLDDDEEDEDPKEGEVIED